MGETSLLLLPITCGNYVWVEKAKYTRNLEAKEKLSQEVFLEEVAHGLFQKLKKLKSGNLTKSRISAGMGKLWEKVQKKGVSRG